MTVDACFLGIDCGTTLIKAVLMDQSFQLLDEEKRPLRLIQPFHGAVEADMTQVYDALCAVTNAIARRKPEHWASLKGVCIAGQGDGLWAIDRAGHPVTNAYLWNDTRARGIGMMDMPGVSDVTARCRTNQPYVGTIASHLMWMKAHAPDAYGRIWRAGHCKDYLNFRLTGRFTTDHTDASNSLYNLEAHRLEPELMHALDIPEAADMMPEVLHATDIMGHVSRAAAGETGLPEGLPVAEGMIDVCAVPVGLGLTRDGGSCVIIGTTLSTEVVQAALDYDPRYGMMLNHAVPGLFLRLMPTLSGTSSMDFVKALLFPDTPYPALEAALDALPVGSDGLIYHPYISGERAPMREPLATAGFFGLRADHTKLHLMRSVFEGLAASMNDCYQPLKGHMRDIYFSGGASVSPVVCQMFADMLGMRCRRAEVGELGALGVIRTLMVALGHAPDFQAFPAHPATSFDPDPARHARYQEVYRLFHALRSDMAPFWHAREAFIQGK